MRSITTLLGAVAAAALVVGLAGPAAAERETQADPQGDTTIADNLRQAPSPAVRNADITRIRTRHAAGVIDIAVEVVRLRATDWSFTFRYRTPDGQFSGYVIAQDGGLEASFYPILGRSQPGDPCQAFVGVDRDTDQVSFAIARGCLGNPDWVRTGAESSVPAGERFRGDDARQRGGRTGSFDGITLGPRVDGPTPF